MLNKFNTLCRIIIVILLAVPIYSVPPAYATEITETETFDGGRFQVRIQELENESI